MSKKSITSGRATVDTRGLPTGVDPHKFYEYAISRRMKETKGLEWLLLNYIPLPIMKSFCIAIDPFSNYRTAAGIVTPTNRQRSRTRTSVLDACDYNRRVDVRRRETISNWNGVSGLNSPYVIDVPAPPIVQYLAGNKQDALADSSKDTTRRTRVLGSGLGEFETSQATIYSPPRNVYRYDHIDSRAGVGSGNEQISIVEQFYHDSRSPSGSVLASYIHRDLVTSEIALAKQLISENSVKLLKRVNPLNRNYTLFRNLVELKDLPRSVVSIQHALMNLNVLVRSIADKRTRDSVMNLRASISDIPKEYVSYNFGWKQLYKDITELMTVPDKITKQINFVLNKPSGDRTFRSQMDIPLPSVESTSGFDVSPLPSDDNVSVKHYITREAKLRIMVNLGFDFPAVMEPLFRHKLFLEKLGVVPSITDFYNLVPWSWMVDWFTGLGNYVEAIDNISKDRTIVNHSLVTCEIVTTLKTIHTSRHRSRITRFWTPTPGYTESDKYDTVVHQSEYVLKTRVRRDLTASMQGVGTTANPSSLTAYQRSILGALLLQRTKFGR